MTGVNLSLRNRKAHEHPDEADYYEAEAERAPPGLSARVADEAFKLAMQKAIATGQEKPRLPAQPADPKDAKVLRSIRGETIVPRASALLNL